MASVLSVTIILWLMLPPTLASSKNITFSEDCPIRYTVMKPDGTELKVDLFQDEKYCKRITQLRKKVLNSFTSSGYLTREDLESPDMMPVAVKDKYFAKFSLKLEATAGGKYPKKMFLEMVMYKRLMTENNEVNDHEVETKCLRLNINNRTADPDWGPLTFSFTCVELVDTEEFLLIASQIWSLPDSRRSKSCRTRRSVLPLKKSCSIHCSQESLFPLSLDGENEYRICTCADKGGLNVTVQELDTGLTVKLGGLPPMIGGVTANILNITGKSVYKMQIDAAHIRNGFVEFTVTKHLEPGNYSLILDAECQFSRSVDYLEETDYKNHVNLMCGSNNEDIYAAKAFDVLGQAPTRPPYETIFGVLTAVTVAGFVTCVIFLLRYRRPKQIPSSSAEPNNGEEAIPLESLHTVTNVQTDIYIHERSSLLGNGPTGGLHDDDVEIPQADSNLQIKCTRRHTNTMMMFHPDNEFHVKQTSKFLQLTEKSGINIKSSDDENWRDFAEGAVSVYSDIVIILSERLNKLCRSFKNRGITGNLQEEFQELIKERCLEYIPCIVMDKLRVSIHQNPSRSDFLLHLITFSDNVASGKKLVEEFVSDHDFLRRTNNVLAYCFTEENIENSSKFQAFVHNTKDNSEKVHYTLRELE